MAATTATPAATTPPKATEPEVKEIKLKIALVTGANKGIGYAICEKLGKIDGIHIILGARDEQRGNVAITQLNQAGIKNVSGIKIDLDDHKSIELAADTIKKKFWRTGYFGE